MPYQLYIYPHYEYMYCIYWYSLSPVNRKGVAHPHHRSRDELTCVSRMKSRATLLVERLFPCSVPSRSRLARLAKHSKRGTVRTIL